MNDKIKFSIPGKPEYLQMVRMALGALATNAGYDVDQTDDIKVAVEEACKLIACHGHSGGFSESYEIEVEPGEKEMTIVVSDFCSCGTIDRENFKYCMNCPEEGNMSRVVIETLMDSFDVEVREDGNKRITMVKNK